MPSSEEPNVIVSRIERLDRTGAAVRLPEFPALLKVALEVQTRAYVPYSGFRVGAAVLTGSGAMVGGCNVEAASYGATICAERTAIVSAIAAGERTVRACVVVTPTPEPASCCGICRQLLIEFGPDVLVFNASSLTDAVYAGTIADMLPLGFGATALDDASAAQRSASGGEPRGDPQA